MKNKRLRLWGAADIGEGFISTVSNTYFSMFLTDIALLPLGLVSVVMMITSVFDFVVAPIAGALITMIKPGKWGRLRSWFVYMPLITTVAYALCYVPVSSGVVCAALITLFYCIARCTYNITWASNLSMIDLVADSPSTRTKLTSQRMAGFNIGKLSSGYVTPVLVAAVAVSIGDRYSYAVMMIVAGVVMTAGYAVHFFLSAGYEDTASTVGDSEPRVGLKQILQALVTNPQLLVTVLIDLTSNMGSFLLPALATYYYKYVAQDTNLLALHMLLTGFGGLAGTLLIRFAGDKIEDHRRTLLAVYPVIALVLFSCRFVAEIPVLFLALNVLCQTITGFTQPLELQLYIAAGIELMAKQLGIKLTDIDEVLLAGAFGSFIDPKSACTIGLLPPILLPRIRAVGNAAGSGAKLLAVSKEQQALSDKLVKEIEFLELASVPDFQRTFGKQTNFPKEAL